MAVTGLIFIGVLSVAVLIWLVLLTDGTYLGSRGVRFIYQRFARVWNLDDPGAFHGRHHTAANAFLSRVLHEAVSQYNSPTILDVATGTARVPLMVASFEGFHGHVTGIDLSRNMLAKGESLVRSAGLEDRVSLIEGDGAALGWRDGTFEVVSCIDAPLAQPLRTIREMARVTKPGGTIVFSKRPDSWMKLMPGKHVGTSKLEAILRKLGFDEILSETWSPSKDLMFRARKGISSKDAEQVSVSTSHGH
ncbi:MAG: class I SAM-dependent methyltransferase [Actinomycetota bacterium]